jgi:hypothetical protein
MKRYTFRGVKYDEGVRVVIADTALDARHEAMCVRWGPPVGIYAPRYKGLGLTLEKVEDLPDETDAVRS